jgi:hypothetical protein
MDNSIAAKTPASSDIPISVQNDVSSKGVATKFLNEIRAAFDPNGFGMLAADSMAHDTLDGLQSDPLKKQAIEQIATDVNDPALMNSLGLKGSVERNEKGDVVSLTLSSPDQKNAYDKNLLDLESSGVTPTQAAEQLHYDFFTDQPQTGTITIKIDQ